MPKRITKRTPEGWARHKLAMIAYRKRKAQDPKWRAKHAAKALARYHKDPEKWKAQRREYYAKNKEAISAKKREWRSKHPNIARARDQFKRAKPAYKTRQRELQRINRTNPAYLAKLLKRQRDYAKSYRKLYPEIIKLRDRKRYEKTVRAGCAKLRRGDISIDEFNKRVGQYLIRHHEKYKTP